MPDYMFLLESRLSPEQRAAMMRVQELSAALGFNVYLTGGTVRDLIREGKVEHFGLYRPDGSTRERVLARVHDLALLYYAGLLAHRPRCAVSLERMLEESRSGSGAR